MTAHKMNKGKTDATDSRLEQRFNQVPFRLLMGEGAMDANYSMPLETNCTFDGLERLTTLGYQVNWLWYDLLALVLFSLVFLVIAYVVLALVKKEK